MSRILLVDDSPHAQRMGERILSEEGFEVVTLSNADSALIRLEDVDPDVVLADTVMPGRSGYEICQFIKMSPRHRHVRVVLTAGVLEPLDDEQVRRVEADATLKKPFEASVLLATVKPLIERALQDRAQFPNASAGAQAVRSTAAASPFVTVVDAEQVRAAVTIALDAAMEKMVKEISGRVLTALQTRKSGSPQAAAAATRETSPALAAPAPVGIKPATPPAPALKPPAVSLSEAKKPADPAVPTPRLDTVRRVSPLRSRPGSFLGLDLSYPDTEAPAAAPRSPASDSAFPNARPAADPDPGSRATLPRAKPDAVTSPPPATPSSPAAPDK
jgi:CheY-like chemotaxis protein